MLAVVVVSVGGLRCVRAHQQPRAPTVPLEACVTATWNGFCFVCTVGRSSGKLVSLMGVLRPGTGKLQSGSAGLELRKATCGPVPTYHSRTRLLARAFLAGSTRRGRTR